MALSKHEDDWPDIVYLRERPCGGLCETGPDNPNSKPYFKVTECKCSMAHSLVGDGCEDCNPQQALAYAREELARLREVKKAAEWYINNLDSPKSAATHIAAALAALEEG